MKAMLVVLVMLFGVLSGGEAFAQNVIGSVPVDQGDAMGFQWLACKGLKPQVTLLGNMQSVKIRADFVKSSVIPNSKGTNLEAGTCSWTDRLIADNEPALLTGATMNSSIEYSVSGGLSEAQGIRFNNNAYLLSGDVFVVRAKLETIESKSLLLNMTTVNLIK